jgi:hypothetical protein
LEHRSVADADRIARRTLTELGFYVGATSSTVTAPNRANPSAPAVPLLVVGERKLFREATDRTVLEALGVVIAGGGVLGVFDALVTKSWVVAPLWIAAFGLIAAVFWFVFGRSYRSDVIVAVIDVDRPSASPPAPPADLASSVSVTWLAGHVRSEVRGAPSSDTRRIARFKEAYGTVSMLASVIRKFQTDAGSSE